MWVICKSYGKEWFFAVSHFLEHKNRGIPLIITIFQKQRAQVKFNIVSVLWDVSFIPWVCVTPRSSEPAWIISAQGLMEHSLLQPRPWPFQAPCLESLFKASIPTLKETHADLQEPTLSPRDTSQSTSKPLIPNYRLWNAGPGAMDSFGLFHPLGWIQLTELFCSK